MSFLTIVDVSILNIIISGCLPTESPLYGNEAPTIPDYVSTKSIQVAGFVIIIVKDPI